MCAPPHTPAHTLKACEQPAYGVPSSSLLERADAGLERFLAQYPEFDVPPPDHAGTA
ncbi:hypothetical protein [Streptomyces sp. NPDC001568]|uniref:hypothetical protein n=1 Tax=Streptomyces sp. NPDC001568 TaxID=3364588 RepID=UPI00369BB51D